jgi:hypothetical protein
MASIIEAHAGAVYGRLRNGDTYKSVCEWLLEQGVEITRQSVCSWYLRKRKKIAMRVDPHNASIAIASPETDQNVKCTDTTTLKQIIQSKEEDVQSLGSTHQGYVTKTRPSSAPNPEGFKTLFSTLSKRIKK